MSNLHAHVESYQSDCDGPISRDYVLTMNAEELADEEMGDLHFTERVAVSVGNFYASDGGTFTVETGVDYRRFIWDAPTEEGHEHREATLCTDECDEDERGQRDYYAESMGY